MNRRAFPLMAAIFLAACHTAPGATPWPELPDLNGHLQPVTKPDRDGRLTIALATLTERAGVPGVFILSDGRARFIMVKPGQQLGDRVEIVSGLMGGETLLLDNLKAVNDGSPVKSLP